MVYFGVPLAQQEVVQDGGLARAEEAREDGDGHLWMKINNSGNIINNDDGSNTTHSSMYNSQYRRSEFVQ